jgi:hypothetical protein
VSESRELLLCAREQQLLVRRRLQSQPQHVSVRVPNITAPASAAAAREMQSTALQNCIQNFRNTTSFNNELLQQNSPIRPAP